MENNLKSFFVKKRNLLFLLGLISLVLIIGGYLFYASEEETISKQKHNELQTIAMLKVNQISDWYLDELSDAQSIARDIFLVEKLENYLHTKRTIGYCL